MVSFFQIAISLLVYVATFSGQLYFGETTYSHFFRVTTSTQQLLFQGSYFFRTAAVSPFSGQSPFRRSCFFRITSFSEELVFSEKLFRIKISKKELFQSRYFCTAQNFQKSYILEKTYFLENRFPHYLPFLESCIFRATTFSKDITFYSSYLFRRATFLKHTFSEELNFHSYGSFPQLRFLFIR